MIFCMVCGEGAEASVKSIYIQLCDKYLHFSFHKLFALQTGYYSIFSATVIWWVKTKSFVQLYTRNRSLSCLLSNNIKTVMFCSIMRLFQKSVSTWQFPGKQSNVCEVLPMLRNVPTCDWSRIDSWQYWISWKIGGRNAKITALVASASSPFSFSAFLPLPLPFFCACHALYNVWRSSTDRKVFVRNKFRTK